MHALLAALLLGPALVQPSTDPAPQPSRCIDAIPEQVVDPVVSPFVWAGGTIVVRALVAPDGSVRAVEVLRPVPALVDPVVHAVRQWRFTPATCEQRLPQGWVRSRVQAWTTISVHVVLVRGVVGNP